MKNLQQNTEIWYTVSWKKKYKNNETKLPDRLSKSMIKKYKDYLNSNKHKKKKIHDISAEYVPFDILT